MAERVVRGKRQGTVLLTVGGACGGSSNTGGGSGE